MPPAMHAAPADFAFGGQAFAVAGGDVAGFAKCFGDQACVAFGILGPLGGAGCGIDAHDAVRPRAQLAQLARDAAGFAHLGDEVAALFRAAHGRSAAGRRPNRRHQRADASPSDAHFVGEARQIVVAGIDADMRIEQKQVDAVESRAVRLGGGGEAQHGVEIDGRLGIGAFAHQSGPHGVVDTRKVVRTWHAHDAPW